MREAVKLFLRRFIARSCDLNFAISKWVSYRQPLPNQIISYAPFSLELFKKARCNIAREYDFIYVGRLVSEKGVADLIKAFAVLIKQSEHINRTLVIVGDGPIRNELEELSISLDVGGNITFVGAKQGIDLIEVIEKAKIAVVPSACEEPFGGVALEFLAAGKSIIVSKQGGLLESVGEAGLSFENGDHLALKECMTKLITDEKLSISLKKKASEQLAIFDERLICENYIKIFESLLA